MFSSDDILYEDNHLLVVNKRCADLVQPDPSGQSALEDQIKAYIKRRDAKPGEVFLGVVHRIDRPVSGAVLFAKTSKALVRLNEMIRSGEIRKTYWAVTEQRPRPARRGTAPLGAARRPHQPLARLRRPETRSEGGAAALPHARRLDQLHARRGRTAYGPPPPDPRPALEDRLPDQGRLEIRRPPLEPRRRHLAPLAAIEFTHPVRREPVRITAPVPAGDNLWAFFARNASEPCAC